MGGTWNFQTKKMFTPHRLAIIPRETSGLEFGARAENSDPRITSVSAAPSRCPRATPGLPACAPSVENCFVLSFELACVEPQVPGSKMVVANLIASIWMEQQSGLAKNFGQDFFFGAIFSSRMIIFLVAD